MVRQTTIADQARQFAAKKKSLSGFSYQNGYLFSVTDLGNRGVKIELLRENQDGAAMILPPSEAAECGKWLLKTIGQVKYSPLRELCEILQRLMTEKRMAKILQRGEKTKIRQALRLLKIQQS